MANVTMPDGPQYHSWKPEPLFRDSCSLNIPEHNKAIAQMWRKLGWMIIAPFAPEWVTHTTLWPFGRVLTEVRSSGPLFASTLTQRG
ncbi:hypothetical protein IG631_19820 [Alternaria alternata]|nr:hypothetical protein IG631_19820 [Alternaria alternata]